MGRRPIPRKNAGGIPARDPRVQAAIDDITLEVLGALREKLRAKVADGDLDDAGFKELMRYFNDMVKATKLPPSTINAIQIPVTNQLPDDRSRMKEIKNSAYSKEELRNMRRSAERFLENDAS